MALSPLPVLRWCLFFFADGCPPPSNNDHKISGFVGDTVIPRYLFLSTGCYLTVGQPKIQTSRGSYINTSLMLTTSGANVTCSVTENCCILRLLHNWWISYHYKCVLNDYSKIPKRSQPILLTWWIPNETKSAQEWPIRPSNPGTVRVMCSLSFASKEKPGTTKASPIKRLQTWKAPIHLVGGFNPIWKICSSNWIISPSRGKNKKYLKPPPSHLLPSRKRENISPPAFQKGRSLTPKMPAGKRIMLVPRRVDLKLYFLKHAVALCFLVVGYVVGPAEQRNMFHQNKTKRGGYNESWSKGNIYPKLQGRCGWYGAYLPEMASPFTTQFKKLSQYLVNRFWGYVPPMIYNESQRR